MEVPPPTAPSMSVVKLIELVLPKDAIYLAGSRVDGQVALTLHSTLVDPVVKVELVGRGHVEWREEAGPSHDYSWDVVCSNKADYVRKTKTFPVADNWLSAGSHTFDFHFNFPPRLPSTFASAIGHVCYYVQASCVGREHVLAKKRTYLLVQGTSDSHGESPIQKPLSVEAEKKVAYRCCRRGTVGLRIQMEKNRFAPGERLVFTTEVANQTGRCVRTVTFALCAHVQYRGFTPKAEQRSREDSGALLRQEASTQIAPFDTAKIVSAFGLPPVLPVSSDAADGDIMSTQYELVGTVHLPWSLTCVEAKVPIVITRTPPDSEGCQPREGAGALAREDCQD